MLSVPDYKTLENDPLGDLDFWHLIGMAAVAQSPVTLPGESNARHYHYPISPLEQIKSGRQSCPGFSPIFGFYLHLPTLPTRDIVPARRLN
jgi:hypothetical protein